MHRTVSALAVLVLAVAGCGGDTGRAPDRATPGAHARADAVAGLRPLLSGVTVCLPGRRSKVSEFRGMVT